MVGGIPTVTLWTYFTDCGGQRMLNETDLKEFYEMLEKNKAEYQKTKAPEIKILLDEQFSLIQRLISVQSKIVSKLSGFNI